MKNGSKKPMYKFLTFDKERHAVLDLDLMNVLLGRRIKTDPASTIAMGRDETEQYELLEEHGKLEIKAANLAMALNNVLYYAKHELCEKIRELEEELGQRDAEIAKNETGLAKLNERVHALDELIYTRKTEYQKLETEYRKLKTQNEELTSENERLLANADPETEPAKCKRLDTLEELTNLKTQELAKACNRIASQEIEIRNLKAQLASFGGKPDETTD